MACESLLLWLRCSGNLLFTGTPADRAHRARATYRSATLFHSVCTFSAICSFSLGTIIWKRRHVQPKSPMGEGAGQGQGQQQVPWLTIVGVTVV